MQTVRRKKTTRARHSVQQIIELDFDKFVVLFDENHIVCQQKEVIANLPNRTDVVFSGLVLNVKGVERAAKTGLKHLAVSLSASETHSQKKV